MAHGSLKRRRTNILCSRLDSASVGKRIAGACCKRPKKTRHERKKTDEHARGPAKAKEVRSCASDTTYAGSFVHAHDAE